MAAKLFDRPIAHRGLHNAAAGIIENSRSAFEAAIDGGYAIECDVQLSSDGVPYIFHDDDFDRLTAATGPSNGKTIGEIQKLILKGSVAGDVPQRFTEFLAQIGGRTLMQIELKQQFTAHATETLARETARALAGYRGPYTLESFDPKLLIALRRAGVRAPIGVATYDFDEPDWDRAITPAQRFILRNLLHWPLSRFDFISCRDVSLSMPAVRLFRAFGMPVTTWTINSPEGAVKALQHADQIVFEGFLPASA